MSFSVELAAKGVVVAYSHCRVWDGNKWWSTSPKAGDLESPHLSFGKSSHEIVRAMYDFGRLAQNAGRISSSPHRRMFALFRHGRSRRVSGKWHGKSPPFGSSSPSSPSPSGGASVSTRMTDFSRFCVKKWNPRTPLRMSFLIIRATSRTPRSLTSSSSSFDDTFSASSFTA
eukprot:gene1946-biopygen1923